MSRARTASVVLAAAVLALGAAAPDLARAAGPALLALGIAAGVPHGALDAVVPAWAAGRRARRSAVVLTALAYAAAVLAALALHAALPLATTVALLGLAVVHFGQADAVDERAEGLGVAWRAAGVLAAGAPAVVLPVALWRSDTDPVLAALAPALPHLLGPALRTALLAVVVAAVVATASRQVRAGRPLRAVEAALPAAMFAVVSPYAAFGVWFGGWHSLRHLARLAALAPAATSGERVRVLVRSAALPTAGGLVLLAALVGTGAPVAAALLGLLALTVPHAVVVARLDRATLRRRRQPAVPALPSLGGRSARLRPRKTARTSSPRLTTTS